MKAANSRTCFLEIEFVLKPGKRREFSRSFEESHRHEGDGHIRTTIYEDCEEPGHMLWIGEWLNRQSLDEYIRREEFGVLLGGLRILGTVGDCCIVDEVTHAGASSSLPPSRSHKEGRLTRIEVDMKDPKIQ